MAEAQDVDALKRRGRRRLVGAIALVLLAVIVLPWIFDQEPRQAPPVSVRIPNEDESPFKPKPVPAPPPPAAPRPAEKPAQPEAKAPDAERARAEAALANVQFEFQVGAYAEPDDVIAKLKAAKIPYYTERVAIDKGTVTRVRAGPFGTREAAERALRRIKALGFKPGGVTTRS